MILLRLVIRTLSIVSAQVLRLAPHLRVAVLGASVVLAAFAGARPAAAHPHVWVDVHMDVVFKAGKVVALEQRWQFDPMFSELMLEDFDTDKNRTIGPDELAEMTKTVFVQLKSVKMFTDLRQAGRRLATGEATGFEAAYVDDRMEIRFRLPLAEALDARAAPPAIAVYDAGSGPVPYIWFEIKDAAHARVAGTGAEGCRTTFEPRPDYAAYGAIVSSGRVDVACGG